MQNPPTEMMRQLFACVLFCNPQYRKKPLEKAQAQHDSNIQILYHDSDMLSTKNSFEAEPQSDRCPDCGKTDYQSRPVLRPATKKKCRIFCGLGMRNGNKPTDWGCQANNTDISRVKLSICARRFPKGDAPNRRRKRSESPLVGRWGKAPYPQMLREPLNNKPCILKTRHSSVFSEYRAYLYSNMLFFAGYRTATHYPFGFNVFPDREPSLHFLLSWARQ